MYTRTQLIAYLIEFLSIRYIGAEYRKIRQAESGGLLVWILERFYDLNH